MSNAGGINGVNDINDIKNAINKCRSVIYTLEMILRELEDDMVIEDWNGSGDQSGGGCWSGDKNLFAWEHLPRGRCLTHDVSGKCDHCK